MRAVNPIVFNIFPTIWADHLSSPPPLVGLILSKYFNFCPAVILLYSLYFQKSTDLHNGNQIDTSLTCSLQPFKEKTLTQ